MAEPFLGEILMFAFSYGNPPQGWAECNGQLLAISQNTALYSLLGTQFGGDGLTTFALPNLQGRVPLHPQDGMRPGTPGGEETHTLTVNEMPQHNHLVSAGTDFPSNSPVGDVWGGGGLATNYEVQSNVTMSANALSPSGNSQPHTNMQPYLVINFCIATMGIFPPRNLSLCFFSGFEGELWIHTLVRFVCLQAPMHQEGGRFAMALNSLFNNTRCSFQ